MKYSMLIAILGFSKLVTSFWPVPYRVALNDRKTFVITAGEDEDENEEESEMIRPDDLSEIGDLVKDEEKYKPLHSHVEHYNRRAAEAANKYSFYLPNVPINLNENPFVEDEKPFIAGFKHDLDKYDFNATETSIIHVSSKTQTLNGIVEQFSNGSDGKNNKNPEHRLKRDEDEEEILGTHDTGTDLVEAINLKNHSLGQHKHTTTNSPDGGDLPPTTEKFEEYVDEQTNILLQAVSMMDKIADQAMTEAKPTDKFRDAELGTPAPEAEEDFKETDDYESLRAEYEEQLGEAKKSNSTYNITDTEEPEETAKDAIKKILDFSLPKNCTEEELTKFGAQAFACLAHDYRGAKNHTAVRLIISKTWRVMKIWICIYICIAVPAWCQKGWCCCCFRCSACFPHERITAAKAYYARNEPGVLVDQPGKKTGKPLKYKPTLFEIDAYEDLESAIRNL